MRAVNIWTSITSPQLAYDVNNMILEFSSYAEFIDTKLNVVEKVNRWSINTHVAHFFTK